MTRRSAKYRFIAGRIVTPNRKACQASSLNMHPAAISRKSMSRLWRSLPKTARCSPRNNFVSEQSVALLASRALNSNSALSFQGREVSATRRRDKTSAGVWLHPSSHHVSSVVPWFAGQVARSASWFTRSRASRSCFFCRQFVARDRANSSSVTKAFAIRSRTTASVGKSSTDARDFSPAIARTAS